MPSKQVLKLAAKDNVSIINALRTDSLSAYEQRIPAATQGDITKTIEALESYKPIKNEFVDALVNRIGEVMIKTKTWTNPLAEFKRGMLNYGDTIEEVYIDIMKAKRYDPNQCYEDVWKCNPPTVFSNFHRINRQDFYEVTITEPMLRRAFLSDTGLSDMVTKILERPYTSDYFDEYLIMRNLFTEMARVDGYFKVQVPDPTSSASYPNREYVAKQITETIRAWTTRISFMSSAYNPMHVTTATELGKLVLFVSPEIEALLDVNVIAQAFNVSAANIKSRVKVIDDFGIEGCVAILADEDFFVCADTYIGFESIRNPKQLSWNYWLHHQGLYSVSRFVNAIMFTTHEGTSVPIPEVSLSSVTLDFGYYSDGTKYSYALPGYKIPLVATVNGTVDPADPGYIVPQSVTYDIVASDVPINTWTNVDAEGWLHVDANEKAKTLTVQVTTTFLDATKPIDQQVQKTATLEIPIQEPTESDALRSAKADIPEFDPETEAVETPETPETPENDTTII